MKVFFLGHLQRYLNSKRPIENSLRTIVKKKRGREKRGERKDIRSKENRKWK